MSPDVLQMLRQSNYFVAYAVKPAGLDNFTVHGQSVAALASIVQAAVKMAKDQDFTNWQADVSDQLDQILASLVEIHRELRALRVWIDERIKEETRVVFHMRINSLCLQINGILSTLSQHNNLPSEVQTRALEAYFNELTVVLDDLMQTDGYTHVIGVVTGATVALPLFQLVGRGSELKIWGSRVLRYLNESLSPTNPKSIEYARNTQAAEFLQKQTLIASRLNRTWRTNYLAPREGGIVMVPAQTTNHIPDREPPDRPERPSRPGEAWVQSATGTIDGGISLAGREKIAVQPYSGAYDWYPELREHYDMGDGPAKSWADMAANLEAYRQDALHTAVNVQKLEDQLKQIREISRGLEQIS